MAKLCGTASAVVLAVLLPAVPAPAQSANLVFTPVAPCRVINTVAVGGQITANTTRSFFVTGTTGFEAQGGLAGGCGIPINATAVAINYVAVGPTGAGNLRAWPFGGSVPNASVVNYAAVGGLNLANGLVQPICNHATTTCTRDLTVRADVSAAFLVADVVGYFREISGTLTLNPDSGTALSTGADVDLRGRVMRGSTPFIQASTPLLSTAIGEGSLKSNTTGSFNTALGSGALQSNTEGTGNVAVGTAALQDNVTGSYNTATGRSALSVNTGDENTAMGYAALPQNATGTSNTAMGSSALYSNTTGGSNTAVGRYALFSNTTAGVNTAVGWGALQRNTQGTGNVAVGAAALQENVTGSYNTGIGRSALGVSTAEGNTAMGYAALAQNTTGLDNTAVGASALYSTTIGDSNTAVGRYALFTLAGTTVEQHNTAIGSGAGYFLRNGYYNTYIDNAGEASENGTIRIGSGRHTRFFAAGVFGVNVVAGTQVFIGSDRQLGTIASSRSFKDDIRDMDAASDGLLRLRPVSFRYKEPAPSGDRPLQYGLIAEEVAQVYPELVVYSESGQPQSVQYHLLSSMLLNELQKQHKELRVQDEQMAAQQQLLKVQDEVLEDVRARLTRLEEERRPVE